MMKIINYDTIRKNIRKIQEKNDLMFVIKDDAYGFGFKEILGLALKEGVRRFAVNDIFEGIRAREVSGDCEILLFGLSTKYVDEIMDYNIIPTASNLTEYNIYTDLKIKFAVEIDVGMNRFGFKGLNQELLKNEFIKYIYVHFPDEKDIEKQILKYNIIAKMYNKEIIYGGSIAIPYTNKCVRVGRAIYNGALELHGKIVNIKYVKKNESIGYDRIYQMKESGYVGIIDIGYKNGINLLYDGEVYIKGNRYKVVGRVCMNQMYILIDNSIKIGDNVEIIGKNIDINEFLTHNKTNIYQAFLLIN